MNTYFDAIVIGAGPAGTAAAITLARQGRSVAIIERSPFPRRKVCGEFTSAINVELLDRLGIGAAFAALAGPPVRRVALFAAGGSVEAPMPKAQGSAFGRALGRDILDALLLARARAAGATLFHPWRAVDLVRGAEDSIVTIDDGNKQVSLRAPVIIAAHGSWEPGRLATNLPKLNRPDDFLGFKAHFLGGSLPTDLMPLLAFPGGYGGMVWSDHDRLSLSFCIRRDALAAARSRLSGVSAAEVAFAHILQACPSVAGALGSAHLAGTWLAAGPIRPGIRTGYADDTFRVGNIAGESHPIIAEGIAMALQSGWILGNHLAQFKRWDRQTRAEAGKDYSWAWRRQFATRIKLASLVSAMAASNNGARLMQGFIRQFPVALSMGARLSGKTKKLPEFVERPNEL